MMKHCHHSDSTAIHWTRQANVKQQQILIIIILSLVGKRSIIIPFFVLFGLRTTSGLCHYYLKHVQQNECSHLIHSQSSFTHNSNCIHNITYTNITVASSNLGHNCIQKAVIILYKNRNRVRFTVLTYAEGINDNSSIHRKNKAPTKTAVKQCLIASTILLLCCGYNK